MSTYIVKEVGDFTQTAIDAIQEATARLKASIVEDLIRLLEDLDYFNEYDTMVGDAESAYDRIYGLVEKYGTKEDLLRLQATR